MPISSIKLQTQIVNVPVKQDFNFRVNVKKDFNFLRYAPTFAGDEMGISFVDFNALNPIQNLTILDHTREEEENSPLRPLEEVKLTSTFSFPKGNFLITDVFITDSNSIQQPQYFKHNLTNLGFNVVDVELLDKNFSPVSKDYYVYYDEELTLGFPSKHIYTNLRSKYNVLDKSSEVYYVRYKNASTFETFVELLNPKPVFTEVLFGSSSAEREYSIQSNINTNDITIHFDSRNLSPTSISSPRVAIRFTEDDRIFVQRPVLTDSNRKWKLRITNGEFYKNVSGSVTDLELGTGDASEDTFNLGRIGIVSDSIVVKVDGAVTEDFAFSAQTGPGPQDQIVFDAPPANGATIVVSYTYDPQVARYYIPEWESQVFSPVRPFKLKSNHPAFVLNSRLIYVEPGNIANLQLQGFYVEIVQLDTEGNVVRALTNNPTADAYITSRGTTTDIFFIKDAIQSINEADGFVRLSVDIDPLLETRITYRYTEEYLEYSDLEVNPSLNPVLHDRKAIVYLKPELSRITLAGVTTSTLDKSIYYLILDKADNIVSASENTNFESFEGTADSGTTTTLVDSSLADTDNYTGFEILILSGPNTGRRLKVDSYNTATKTLTVSGDTAWVSAITSGVRYRINRKYDSYSVTDPVTSSVISFVGWKEIHTVHPDFSLILAEVRPNNTTSIDGLGLLDIRVRGGGIADTKVNLALGAQSQATWYWDLGSWDGRSYPGMGALLVELPRSILQERGGAFTPKQVQDIVYKHMADGYYPLIRYYDRSTNITLASPQGNGKVYLEWLAVGADEYKISYGLNPLNLNLEETVDGEETSFFIENLESNKIYYFSVTAYFGSEEQYPSRLASVVPYSLSAIKPPATYGVDLYGEGSYNNT